MSAADDSTALKRAGTAAIEGQRFGEALEAFTRAAAIRPDDASLCFGAGVAAFMLGRNDEAQTRFECALALDPKHLMAMEWLADLHYRAGRLHRAISIYEAALQHSPGERRLQEQLALWRKEHELHSRFREVRSQHFIALFELAADEPIARDALQRLEAAYRRAGDTLGVYPSKPVIVVLYTREQFAAITKLAAWSAAAYDGRIHVPIDNTLEQGEELDRVLSHEFVHALVAMVGGRTVPAWLNEGLATVLEPAGSREAEAPLARAASRVTLLNLHRSFITLSRRNAEIAYAASAGAVRRLIEQRGAAAVVALLEDLKRGTPFDRAFHQRLSMRYEEFATLVQRD